jgi:hypothetical protein
MDFIVQAILQPAAETLGVPVGVVQSGLARLHDGSPEACILLASRAERARALRGDPDRCRRHHVGVEEARIDDDDG